MSGSLRICYDSTSATDIPADAELVAGYIDGPYAWSEADWQRFPAAVRVRIAIAPWTNDGHVLDVESGDAMPYQAPGWVTMRRAAGIDPTVYVNLSNFAAVRTAFAADGVPEPHYWLAHYDNDPSIPDGVVAKQYCDPPASGGHYDLTAVLPIWPGVDSQGDDMTPEQDAILRRIDLNTNGSAGNVADFLAKLLQTVDADVKALAAHSDPAVAAAVARIEAALKQA